MNTVTKIRSRVIAAFVAAAMLLSCFSFTQADSHAASATKQPYEEGDNISNAVFYIAVDGDGNGKVTDEADAVYYYSYDEIKNAGEEVAYHYGNHGAGETANVKGAKLSTLLDSLQGVEIGEDWIIQYMEEDAYHATAPSYQDTVKGLTDEDGEGNGSDAGIAAETIIGYANKTLYDDPDANNVNETEYTPFLEYEREASYVRAYRQTNSANSSVLKLLKGVVVSNNEREDGAPLPSGKSGYQLKSVNASGTEIADVHEVVGLLEGMAWPATPNVDVPWAKLDDDAAKVITIGSDAAQEVLFQFVETPFFSITKAGQTKTYIRSELAGVMEYPDQKTSGYKYIGYNKPMYVRYHGVWLKDLVGTLGAGEQVFVTDSKGQKVNITSRLDDFFVACYYEQSKRSTNISNEKRVPLNYNYAVLVDTASAPIEYSNNDNDYETASGKEPTVYQDAKVIVEAAAAPVNVTGLSVKLSKYNRIRASWKAVAGASGYTVYYKAGKGSWRNKNVTATSTTLTGLKKGTVYAVRVKAYKKVGTTTLYSAGYSAQKSATTLKAPILRVKKSKKRASIRIQNIKGESGYQIYQKIGSKGKYRQVKRLKANRTSWKSKTLKRNKNYYYKVRAYKTVDGKRIHSPWSKVKKIKR